MYTVCPECKTAFRLNAKILKQAHGRVRCGGCSSTFNAIDHLSEDLPDDEPGNTQTAHTFDERSKELLHTLDQLTGPDAVRIEDTGVEWRVLDVDSDSGNDGDDDDDTVEDDDTDPVDYKPADEIQWSLEEPDYELPADTGSTAEYSALAATELEASDDEPENSHSEAQPAYSDDIGIEDDDDSDDAEIDSDAGTYEVAEDVTAESPSDETADPRQDFRYDDNTPLPDEFFRPSDDFPVEPDEADSALQEPAITADPYRDETPTMAGDDAQADLTFGDIDEWQDLLSEVATDDDAEPAGSEALTGRESVSEIDSDSDSELDTDEDGAGDTALQNLDNSDDDQQPTDNDAASAGDVSLELAAPDSHDDDDAADPDAELIVNEFVPDPDAPKIDLDAELVADESEEPTGVHPVLIDGIGEQATDDENAADHPEDKQADDVLPTDPTDEAAPSDDPSADSAQDPAANDELSAEAPASDDATSDNEVEAAQAFDELSVEMEIDQELLRAAALQAGDEPADKQDEQPEVSENRLVETIIMEGDTVTDLIGDTELKFNTALLEASPDGEEQTLDNDSATTAPPPSRRLRGASIAAAAGLVLLLAVQLLHANRATLATSPVFENTLAPLYRAIGQPVTPAWDVRGWRFESTTGSTDNADQRLTINSRIANKSTQALPYPLVYVSLTDRFEEIVGSRILRPDEYLAGNVSYRKPVAPDADFNAVITIDSPAPEATGFKLNVCYRTGSQQLRCAIEDFRN